MKFSHARRISGSAILLSVLMGAGSASAGTTAEVTQAASAVIAKDGVKPSMGTAVPKVTATTGSVTGNAGNNQYPAGTIPTPPKPKKEGGMVAGSIAVKGGENQYPAGTIPTPPKPKKEGLEAAGAVKAKAAQP